MGGGDVKHLPSRTQLWGCRPVPSLERNPSARRSEPSLGKSYMPFWTNQKMWCPLQSSLCLLRMAWGVRYPFLQPAPVVGLPFPCWWIVVVFLVWVGFQYVALSHSIQTCRDRDLDENDNTCIWTSYWDLLSTCQATSRLCHPWFASGPYRSGQSAGWSWRTFQWGVWSIYPPVGLQVWLSSIPCPAMHSFAFPSSWVSPLRLVTCLLRSCI